MSTLGQQKLLSYQYLPVTEITLHTEQQLRHMKHKSILTDAVIDCNNKMQEYIAIKSVEVGKQANDKEGLSTDNKIDFRKWAKEVEKICGHHCKLTEVEKIQLFNNAVTKTITSEPQLVLILSKLHSLSPKDRHSLFQKCTIIE